MTEKLRVYLDYLRKTRDANYMPTPEEREANYYVNSDPALAAHMEKVKAEENLDQKINMIENLIKELEEELKKNEGNSAPVIGPQPIEQQPVMPSQEMVQPQPVIPTPEIPQTIPSPEMPQPQPVVQAPIVEAPTPQIIENNIQYSPEEIAAIQSEIAMRGMNIPVDQVLNNMNKYYDNVSLIEQDLNSGLIDQGSADLYNHLYDNIPKNKTNGDSIANRMTLKSPDLPPSRPKAPVPTEEAIRKDQRGIVSIFILAMVLFVIAAIILFTMKS